MHYSIRRLALAASALTILAPSVAIASDKPEEAPAGPGDPIVVTGKRDGYGLDKTSTATKTDTDLSEIPQAVSVVTAEQINDQAMRSIGDTVRYVPGVSMESGEGHRDAVAIRGNVSTADFFTDGLRDDVQHYRGLYNVERIEVLKGPNALIFGRGGGGGIVNRVLKRPFHDRYFAGAVSLDQYGAGNAQVDLNTPISADVEGRLNAVYEWFDNFRAIEGDRWAVNPTLSWHVGPATRIDLGYEYAQDERDVDRGIPSIGGRPLEGYDETFFGVRGVNRTEFDKNVVDARIEHDFGGGVTFTSKALYGDYDKSYFNATPSSEVTDVDGVPSVSISAYGSTTLRKSFLWQNDLVARFTTGAIDHTFLVGVDYADQDTDSTRVSGFFDGLPADMKSADGRSTWVPLAQTLDIPALTFRDGPGQGNATSNAQALGMYAQDQLSIGPVELIAGLRHDRVEIEVTDRIANQTASRTDSLWSPRLGAVVKPSEGLSLYASWSRSFLPQSGDQFSSLSPSRATLEPERFTNREIGAKWSPMPNLDVTIAAFRLDNTNTRATDPVTFETVLTGATRTEGVEIEASGKVGRLSLHGGMSWLDGEIREDSDAAAAGTKLPHVPEFQASLWGRYDVSDRMGLGLGVSHRSSVYASYTNDVKIDPLTLVDAAFFYDLTDRIALQVNAKNLLGADGIETAHNDNNLQPVDDRSVSGTIRFAF